MVMLHAGGERYPVPLPYGALSGMPLLRHARNPSRIIVFAYLCLSVLCAFSLKHLLAERLSRPGSKALLAGVLDFDHCLECKSKEPISHRDLEVCRPKLGEIWPIDGELKLPSHRGAVLGC